MAIRRDKSKNSKATNSSKNGTIVPGEDPKKVITGICRSTFMRVLALTGTKMDPDKKQCGTAIIIDKSDKKTVKAIKKAITAACHEKFGSDFDAFKSKKLKNPLKDGDELLEDPDNKIGREIEGAYLINAKSFNLPQVVNKYANPITDRDELQEICVSGYYFRFSLYFKASEFELDEGGKIKCVNCYLNNLMFVKEGEALSGGSSAKDDFSDFAEEPDDEYEDEDEGDDED